LADFFASTLLKKLKPTQRKQTPQNAYCCEQLSYTEQQRTGQIIFLLILQKIITAQMLSIGGYNQFQSIFFQVRRKEYE